MPWAPTDFEPPQGGFFTSGSGWAGHAQTVVSARGDMALMRTVHPLDFIQVKRALARSPARDPLKARKDALQAEVVQYLWQTYLQYQDTTDAA